MDTVKLDLGCGKNKKEGFVGVDKIPFEGVDVIMDLTERWPWEDNSVSEIFASHLIEHLTAETRVHFVNEAFRVLVPRGTCQIITPHWASCRAYGDLTHEWPPVSEFWYYYLNAEWRNREAPHNTDYICDFDATWGYNMREDLSLRNQEYQLFALSNYKEVAQDLIATITKR